MSNAPLPARSPASARMAPVDAISSVWPSAGELATCRVPIRPAAPGRYSDDDRRTPEVLQLDAEHAAEHVGRAAGRERHDDPDRRARKVLRVRGAKRRERRKQGTARWNLQARSRLLPVLSSHSRPSPDRARPAAPPARRPCGRASRARRRDRRQSTCPRRPATSAPTIERTWVCRNERAEATTWMSSLIRCTSSRSSVFTGDFAWHSASRKVVKSCWPTSRCAAACMAALLSGLAMRQARPRSKVRSARRLMMR